ncbi:gustatory receptor 46 [Danaus plexippus plexippus]|uniref:Gustatory receptor 46 n=2 Tax=Danaus plexippus TaxID=13037 RepID=A0A212F7Y7_DANPL|nr:gustatory receptor 46 [Danaus plexippus plexippus]
MRNHLKGLPNGREVNSKFFLPTRKSMRCVVANMHELNSSATDEYLKDIFDVISRFQELFRFQVLLFCFKFVLTALLVFEFILLAMQNNILRWLEFILLPFQTVIDLMMIVVFCVRCEAFRIEIQDIKRLSTTLLSIYQEGPIREKARKMLKLINEKPPHISVYDMWNMDASTMLNMINVVTTLLVTLLQFALL